MPNQAWQRRKLVICIAHIACGPGWPSFVSWYPQQALLGAGLKDLLPLLL